MYVAHQIIHRNKRSSISADTAGRQIDHFRVKLQKNSFNMPAVYKKRQKKNFRSFQLLLPILRFGVLLLIFLGLQTIGEGLDFCFDGSKEGMFLRDEDSSKHLRFSRTPKYLSSDVLVSEQNSR